jgi:hypothetical protein
MRSSSGPLAQLLTRAHTRGLARAKLGDVRQRRHHGVRRHIPLAAKHFGIKRDPTQHAVCGVQTDHNIPLGLPGGERRYRRELLMRER